MKSHLQVQRLKFSPNGQYFALIFKTKVEIRSIQNQELIQNFQGNQNILDVQFCPDSENFLIRMFNLIEGRSIYKDWQLKIEDSQTGIQFAKFITNCDILTFSDFNLKATLYSLTDNETYTVKNPKHINKGFAVKNNYLALAENKENKDYISIYDLTSYQMFNYFFVDTQDLTWNQNQIIVWDTFLEYKILICCPIDGVLYKYQPYLNQLGIKQVKFSKDQEIMAIGSYDDKLRLLNTTTWQLIIEISCKSKNDDYILYKEEEIFDANGSKTKYNIIDNKKNIKFPQNKPNFDEPNPKAGVSSIKWSQDSQYFTFKIENCPQLAYIYKLRTLSLIAIVQSLTTIQKLKWSPIKNQLFICNNSSNILIWNEDQINQMNVAQENQFKIKNIQFNKQGSMISLQDKNQVFVGQNHDNDKIIQEQELD